MEVTLRAKNIRTKKKIFKDHYWYDPISRQELHGYGGRMIFVYDPISKRNKPRIIDHEEWITENNYQDLLKWVNKQGLDIQYKAPGLYIIINVDALEWPVLEDTLYQNNIPYDYDVHELKKEKETKEIKWQNSQLKFQTHRPHWLKV